METRGNEELRKAVQSVRHLGSKLNMSLPIDRLKLETKKIRSECEKLIELLGGE